MKDLLKISLKNVLKSRERVILTFLILSFGAFFYVSMSSLMSALLNMTNNDVRIEQTSDIRIRINSFDEENPISQTNLMVYDDSIEGTPRLIIPAEADNYENVLPIQLIGINPQSDSNAFIIHTSEDTPLEEGTVYIGARLAKDLELGIGDYVNITFRTLDQDGTSSTRSSSYCIADFLTSSITLYNEQAIIIDINDLWNQLGTNVVTDYSIKISPEQSLTQVAQKLQQKYPNNEVVTWEYLTKEARDSIEMRQAFLGIFLALIVLITLVGLMNTILISVWEKRKITGTLRALGYTNNELMFLFVLEGFWIGLIGACVGVILAIFVNIPLSTIGINFADMMTVDGVALEVGMQVPPVIRSTWNLITFITPIIFMPIAAMAVSIFPAKKSVAMSITDCLRNKD